MITKTIRIVCDECGAHVDDSIEREALPEGWVYLEMKWFAWGPQRWHDHEAHVCGDCVAASPVLRKLKARSAP